MVPVELELQNAWLPVQPVDRYLDALLEQLFELNARS